MCGTSPSLQQRGSEGWEVWHARVYDHVGWKQPLGFSGQPHPLLPPRAGSNNMQYSCSRTRDKPCDSKLYLADPFELAFKKPEIQMGTSLAVSMGHGTPTPEMPHPTASQQCWLPTTATNKFETLQSPLAGSPRTVPCSLCILHGSQPARMDWGSPNPHLSPT